MIIITGDTHGTHDIHKLANSHRHCISQYLTTKNDYLIIAGDFGLVWNNDAGDRYWQKWLNKKTICCITSTDCLNTCYKKGLILLCTK